MSAPDIVIHPSAVVHPKARLEPGVWIGPGCVVGPDVRSGQEHVPRIQRLHHRGGRDRGRLPVLAVLSIGTEPQDIGYKDDATLRPDRRRQHLQGIHHRQPGDGQGRRGHPDRRPTTSSWPTPISPTTARSAARSSSPTTPRWAATSSSRTSPCFGGFTGVHQFCRIGRFAFTGGFTVVTQDVPALLQGRRACARSGSSA